MISLMRAWLEKSHVGEQGVKGGVEITFVKRTRRMCIEAYVAFNGTVFRMHLVPP